MLVVQHNKTSHIRDMKRNMVHTLIIKVKFSYENITYQELKYKITSSKFTTTQKNIFYY